jgi:hypothetical protein
MVVRADADGYPLVEPQLVVIDCKLQESDLRAKYPLLWKYLESAEGLGLESLPARNRSPWYRQEDRDSPPFLCTYMGRKNSKRPLFRFIWNQSDHCYDLTC